VVEALCYKTRVRHPMRPLNFLNLPNTSGRTISLGFTQPLTEMSRADSLTATCEPIV
jgi:hypothetical protein